METQLQTEVDTSEMELKATVTIVSKNGDLLQRVLRSIESQLLPLLVARNGLQEFSTKIGGE